MTVKHSCSTPDSYDVVVIGTGLAGLASALELARRNIGRIALIGPIAGYESFASSQPAIATHPHYSADFNRLSEWTATACQAANKELLRAASIKPSLVIGRGRWTIPASESEARKLRSAAHRFNQNAPNCEHNEWHEQTISLTIAPYGALFAPSAWVIKPLVLQRLWLDEFFQLGGVAIDAHVQATMPLVVTDQAEGVWNIQHHDHPAIESSKIVLAVPKLIEQFAGPYMPISNRPGVSETINQPELTEHFGQSAVRLSAYALPFEAATKTWLSPSLSSSIYSQSTSVQGIYAGDRWSAPDRLPYVGQFIDTEAIQKIESQLLRYERMPIPALENYFVNSAHGSRGLISGILGAQVVADLIASVPLSLSTRLQQSSSSQRYVRRVCNA